MRLIIRQKPDARELTHGKVHRLCIKRGTRPGSVTFPILSREHDSSAAVAKSLKGQHAISSCFKRRREKKKNSKEKKSFTQRHGEKTVGAAAKFVSSPISLCVAFYRHITFLSLSSSVGGKVYHKQHSSCPVKKKNDCNLTISVDSILFFL